MLTGWLLASALRAMIPSVKAYQAQSESREAWHLCHWRDTKEMRGARSGLS